MTTIYDIAKITGYSVATVSRVLSGSGDFNTSTCERIHLAADLTGFNTVNNSASSVKHSRLIGAIVENESFSNGLVHPLFGGILTCFREQVAKAGYDLIYLTKQLNSGMSYIDHCRFRNIEGILITNSLYDDPEVNRLAESGIPCVSSNEFIPGICTVVSENTQASRFGVEYLIQNGHSQIGYIGGPFQIRSPCSIERCEGYRQALKSAGIKYEADKVIKADSWELESGYAAAEKLFTAHPELTAVFCACDTIAVGAMQYLEKSGRHVPDDVSIVGFDDTLVSNCCTPPISTFRQDRERIACTCAEKLVQAINGKKNYEIIRVPVEFVERQSVRNIAQA